MVIIPGSMATPNGLTFTIGQITWTTGSDNFIAMTTEEAQIQSASTTASPASATAPTTLDLAPATPASSSATPKTRRSFPRYKGRQIDNTDLLDSIDQVGTKLAETLALVDSKSTYRAGNHYPQQIYPTSSGQSSCTTRYGSRGHIYS